MAVQVYGCNHVAIEVDDAEKAVAFYSDVFNLEMLRGGEGVAWCKLGEHQFLAIFEVKDLWNLHDPFFFGCPSRAPRASSALLRASRSNAAESGPLWPTGPGSGGCGSPA